MADQDTLDQHSADTQDPGTGDLSGNWRENLDTTLKEHPSLSKYKTINELASAYLNAQKFVGREKLPVPKSSDDKEAFDIIFDRLGRPKDSEGYILPEIEMPSGVQVPKEQVKEYKKLARDIGLLPEQANALYKWYMESTAGEYTRLAETQQESEYKAETSLRKEYGRAYEQNVAIAQKVIKQFADTETAKLFSEAVGNDPRMVRFLVNIGKKMGQHGFIEGRSPGIYGPAEAKKEINRIRGDSNHPYWIQNHPEHDEAVSHMSSLQQMASPETS